MINPAKRQRILLITRNLPPLVGGMERLNWHMAEELSRVADVHVVGPEGSAAIAPAGVTIVEAPLRPLWKFLSRARVLARTEARTWKPDIVLAGSGLTAPLVRSAARICSAQTAAYVHGLDLAVRHPVYRAIWLPALRRMDHIIANSRATADLCRGIGIDHSRIGIVHPGVDFPAVEPLSLRERSKGEGPDSRDAAYSSLRNTSSFRTSLSGDPESTSASDGFRNRHQLANRPLLLSVGRLSSRKGLREFVAYALPVIVAARPDVMLLIVGDAPKDALHAAAQSPDSIRTVAAEAGVADNLRFLGKVSDIELDAAFGAADVHVFPVREIAGDPEGFGMVAIEAAARGLPTVAFASGGVVDAVAEGQSGHLIKAGDYTGFADAVTRVLAERGALRSSCVSFAQGFAWPRFGARLVAQLAIPVTQ